MILNGNVEIFQKELCIGCKRIFAQQPCIVGAPPVKVSICKRCTQEVAEMARVYCFAYDYKAYFVEEIQPPEGGIKV